MTNNQDWENLGEQELIEILNRGNFSEEEMDEFIKVLEKRGISGSIMRVGDLGPDEEKALKDYLDYHKKLPKDPQNSKEISGAIKVLSDRKSSLESLKKAIIILAHSGDLNAYEALKSYSQDPRKELLIWLQQALHECEMFLKSDLLGRPIVEKKDIESVQLDNKALANPFFQDFLIFLKSLKERSLELTPNGNLRLKEIESLSKKFLTDIYEHRRTQSGKIRYPIRREEEVFHLQLIRVLAATMRICSKRKSKLKITRFGLKFLEFSPFEQFVDITLNYLGEYNWAYLRPYRGHNSESIAEILQSNQGLIYSMLMFQKDWLNFKDFAQNLTKELSLSWKDIDSRECQLLVFSAIESVLVKDLARLGLVEYEEKDKLKGFFKEIARFRLSKLGRLIIPMFLETYKPSVDRPKVSDLNVVLPQIKLKYFKKEEEAPKYSNTRCHFCGRTDIVVGAYLDAYTNNPKTVCEDCAIDHYQKDFGYKTREIAAAKRRRSFDVPYLFFEMVVDCYLAEKNIPSFDSLNESQFNYLMGLSKETYNTSLSRQEKNELEETVDQAKIEARLRVLLRNIGRGI